ncbi:hypothetical protein ASPCAL04315 [Aspergillus calidoustus]|uniref:DUF6594 domain-containing protein n=1 Tax=Aspergillus calidoustus TaxID=454130 RepID=A0A0U5FV45_ASPCI|nr:hypothetical protein ASPCAL04315 [Aspergillus calidoustus]
MVEYCASQTTERGGRVLQIPPAPALPRRALLRTEKAPCAISSSFRVRSLRVAVSSAASLIKHPLQSGILITATVSLPLAKSDFIIYSKSHIRKHLEKPSCGDTSTNGVANRSHPPESSSPKEGFANVARWIALDQDSESLIYRGFCELSARNILYLQCEMLGLEKRLNELDKMDAASDDMEVKDAARTWETLREQFEGGNQDAQARMELILRLRGVVKEVSCVVPSRERSTIRRG